MEKLKQLTVEEFIKDLGSNSPAPGGGSVAALASSLAGASLAMVYSLTVGKKAYEMLNDELKKKVDLNLTETIEFYNETLDCMDKDKQVFLELMASFKMPKETDEEKNLRIQKINQKTYEAMMVPLELLRKSMKFYENINFGVEYGNKNVVSDAGVAAIMLHSSIESAVLNVRINLASLKDENLKANILTEINDYMKISYNKKEEIIKKVNLIIG